MKSNHVQYDWSYVTSQILPILNNRRFLFTSRSVNAPSPSKRWCRRKNRLQLGSDHSYYFVLAVSAGTWTWFFNRRHIILQRNGTAKLQVESKYFKVCRPNVIYFTFFSIYERQIRTSFSKLCMLSGIRIVVFCEINLRSMRRPGLPWTIMIASFCICVLTTGSERIFIPRKDTVTDTDLRLAYCWVIFSNWESFWPLLVGFLV